MSEIRLKSARSVTTTHDVMASSAEIRHMPSDVWTMNDWATTDGNLWFQFLIKQGARA